MMNKERICSDTMTSCQTILNNYVSGRMPDALAKYGVKWASNKMTQAKHKAAAVPDKTRLTPRRLCIFLYFTEHDLRFASYCCSTVTMLGISCFFRDTSPFSLISTVSSGSWNALLATSFACSPKQSSSVFSFTMLVSIT